MHKRMVDQPDSSYRYHYVGIPGILTEPYQLPHALVSRYNPIDPDPAGQTAFVERKQPPIIRSIQF